MALFDHPRLIEQDHTVGRTERLGDQVVMSSDHRCARPSTLADEMLRVVHIHPLPQGDTFTGFAGLLAQQTVQVDGSPGGLFGAPKRFRLCDQYRRLAARRNKKHVAVAVGQTILVIGYHLITREMEFEDLGPHYFDERDRVVVQRLIRRRSNWTTAWH